MSQFHPLTVSDVRRETDESVSIRFDVPPDLQDIFRFVPGQYLTLRTEIGGEEIRRSYSVCAGLQDGELRVAVKRVADGTFSTYANENLAPGTVLDVMPPEGRFTPTIEPDRRKSYLLIAAGSGITPVLSIAKSVLALEPRSEVTLVYGNRSASSILFKEELDDLKDRYPTRYRLMHILSRQPQDIPLLNGRIDREKCDALFDCVVDPLAQDEIFICGPQEMTETVKQVLSDRGVTAERIHVELFLADGDEKAARARRERAETLGQAARDTRRVTIIWDGIDTDLEIAPDGPSILDAALEKRSDMPYSCKGGMCCTCRAKLRKGEVAMDVNYTLTDAEVADGFVLACQSHPMTDEVLLDFDER